MLSLHAQAGLIHNIHIMYVHVQFVSVEIGHALLVCRYLWVRRFNLIQINFAPKIVKNYIYSLDSIDKNSTNYYKFLRQMHNFFSFY